MSTQKLISVILLSIALFTGLAFINKNSKSGIDLNGMNTSIAPGTDFYRYANGNWLLENPVPASESRWSSFNMVEKRNNEVLKSILEQCAADKKAEPNSIKGKVGTFYRVFMDTQTRNIQGIKPVLPLLSAIDGINNKTELMDVVASLHTKGIRCFFGFYVGQDLKNSQNYISYFSQGGISLPDKDYYLKTDARSLSIRNAFAEHINKLGELYALAQKPDSKTIIDFETELAKVSMSRTERRNREKQYNKRSYEQLTQSYPQLRLDLYLQKVGAGKPDSLLVSQPDFFSALNQLMEQSDLAQLKMYMRWCVMNQSAGFLSLALERQNYTFYSATLTGTKEQMPLWRRGIAATNNVVGELLGQLFVEKVFTPSSKVRVNAMVDDIVEAFRNRLNQLTWMSAETREKALIKLASFSRKFGYPDVWKDYTKLEIKPDSYFENHIRSNEFGFRDMVENLGKPIDRNRWGMLPQTVNAYYNPSLNEIVFPAAIMQAPFFDPNADDAVNYGSIGAVIGHELTHGFDDQGAKYGADGNMKSWWQEADKKLFEEKTSVLVQQFNAYVVADSLHINGELTLGENIADLGGLTIAYEALQNRLKTKGRKNIDGFSPEQRFFIGFAQVWKNNIRPEALRQLILTDPHSPAEYRVKGTLSNMPAFYEAFQIKPGDPMYRKPEDRAQIW